MSFLKKNWLSIMSLALCICLLGVIWSQRREIRQLTADLDSTRMDLHGAEQDLFDLAGRVREEVPLVLDYDLETTGVDFATHSLLADASVTLQTWEKDTHVTLLLTMAEETTEVPLSPSEDGVFTAPIVLPIEFRSELTLDISILSNGTNIKENLIDFIPYDTLLPLRRGGCGYTKPSYMAGTFRQDGWFYVDMTDWSDNATQVNSAEFRFYKNGELLQRIPGTVDQTLWESEGTYSYIPTREDEWSVECKEDDNVFVTFFCRDDYGLGYEFFVHGWTIQKWSLKNGSELKTYRPSYDERLKLIWE